MSIKNNEIIKKTNSDVSTGDVVYQLDNLSKRIKVLQDHLSSFKKDTYSKLALYKLVAKRKNFLRYLERKNFERYSNYLKTSNLRVSNK